MDALKKRIKLLDTKYPTLVNPNISMFVLIAVVLGYMVFIIMTLREMHHLAAQVNWIGPIIIQYMALPVFQPHQLRTGLNGFENFPVPSIFKDTKHSTTTTKYLNRTKHKDIPPLCRCGRYAIHTTKTDKASIVFYPRHHTHCTSADNSWGLQWTLLISSLM